MEADDIPDSLAAARPVPVEVRLRPGDYHKVRFFAASFAAASFAALGFMWGWVPGLVVAVLAVVEAGHAAYHMRPGVGGRPSRTIVIDIIFISAAFAVVRAPAVSVIPAFGYLVVAPILLASGRRAIAIVSFALVAFTAAGFVGTVAPPTIEWTFGRTLAITLVLLGVFGPVIVWLIAIASRQLEQRERYRQRLEESEHRLSEIFNSAPIGMELVEAGSWEISAANTALGEFLGYSAEELVGMSVKDIVHPEDLAATAELALAVREGRLDKFQRNRRYIRADGRIVWGSFHLSPVRGRDGRPELLIGQVQDITVQREIQLQRDLLHDLTMQVVAAPSADGAMKSVLAGLGRAEGWTFGEIWKPDGDGEMVRIHTWFDDPKLEEFERASLKRVEPWSGLPGGVSASETSISLADIGAESRLLSEGLPADHGLEVALSLPITVGSNVMAVLTLLGRRRSGVGTTAQETMKPVLVQLGYVIGARLAEDERDRLAAILENTTDFVGFSDRRGRTLYVNAAGRTMLGIPLGEDLSGRAATTMHPPDVAQRILDEAIPAANGDGSWRGETRLLTRDGREIPVSQVVIGHRSDEGEVTFYSTVARDISNQKALEVHQESLIKAKNEFIASVSHELRTPLTAIQGFASLLVDPDVQLGDFERIEMLRTIADEAQDVGNIVEDLLVAARADIEQLTITPITVSVDALIGPLVDSIRWYGRNVEVNATPTLAVGDPLRIRQILRNLCTNAARYGGPTVRIVSRTESQRVVVEVQDNGAGIKDADMETIFAPYRRAHEQPGVPGSVGLGLSVSRQLARLMGGDVEVQRESNWTVFELSLPRPGAPSA